MARRYSPAILMEQFFAHRIAVPRNAPGHRLDEAFRWCRVRPGQPGEKWNIFDHTFYFAHVADFDAFRVRFVDP